MVFSKESVEKILNDYNVLFEKIEEIVDIHGKVDDCSYDIKRVEFLESCLNIDVEFYKWMDTNWSNIVIPLELLTDDKDFSDFKKETEVKINERLQAEEQKKQLAKEKKIEEAKKYLRDNNINDI